MKGVLLAVCFVVGLLPSDARDCDHQIVCQRLRQVAEHACATYGVAEGVVIRPKGEKGDRGEPAVVDYERIIQKVEELHLQEIDALVIKGNETKEAIENLNKSLTSFAEKTERAINTLMIKDNEAMAMIEKLNESIAMLKEENKKKDEEFCKVYYGGRCFWFVRQHVNYAEGEAICSKIPGGYPAIIYNDENYQQIQEYIRSLMADRTTLLRAWLGLKFDSASGKVAILSGGTGAPFMKWYPGYPSSTAAWTNIVLQVVKYPNSSTSEEGMWNNYPIYNTHGVLCEA